MRKVLFVVALFFLVTAPLQASTSNTTTYLSKQQQADQQYSKGQYTDALRNYLRLAKQGDSFAQYRASYMYLQGQGQKTDIVEAFAWATLSAQNKADPLIEYRDAVARLVPPEQQRKAMRKLDYYMRKWGNRALASDMITKTERELQECTGSRLGNRCEEVYAAQMPKFWGANSSGSPTKQTGIEGVNSRGGSRSSSSVLQPGAPERDVAYYQGLRARIDELNRYIGDNSGSVELGVFEVVEDKPATTSDDESLQK